MPMNYLSMKKRTFIWIVCLTLLSFTVMCAPAIAADPLATGGVVPAPGSGAPPIAVSPASGTGTAPLAVIPGAAAGQEAVLFEDNFQRGNSGSPGPNWEEFFNRRTDNNVSRPGDSPWCIKNGTLYFEATGQNSYIEDIVQTKQAFPIDNTKVEFEMRATAATRLGYVGPSMYWLDDARYKGGACNVSQGNPVVGVEAWYRWENAGTKGLMLMGNGSYKDYASAYFSGLNQSSFAKHTIIIKDGKITYQSPDLGPVELTLGRPIAPGELRHLTFSSRLYDAGVKSTIEIKSVKITSLAEPAPLGVDLENEIETELSASVDRIAQQAEAEFDPMIEQFKALPLARTKAINEKVSAMVAAQIRPAVQTAITAQIEASAANATAGGGGAGMPDLSMAPPEIRAQVQAQIAAAKAAAKAQVAEQVTASVQQLTQQQMALLKPGIDQMVTPQVAAITAEMKPAIQQHIKVLAPRMSAMVDTEISKSMDKLYPMLPADIKKLPKAQAMAKLKAEMEPDLRPQIEAVIDDKVQELVQRRITQPIENEIMTSVAAQVDQLTAELGQYAEKEVKAKIPDSGDSADIESQIKSQMQNVMADNRAYILSQVQADVTQQTLDTSREMDSFAKAEVKNALTPAKATAPAAGGKKVLKRALSIKKK